jgi:hypothetical protein
MSFTQLLDAYDSRCFRNRTSRPVKHQMEFWPITMNEIDLRAERTAVAYPSRSRVSESPNLTLIDGGRLRKQTRSVSLMRRFLTTLAALLLLVGVLKFLPPMSKHSDVQATHPAIPASTSDLHVSGVQITPAPDGLAIYLDGIVTNTGNGRVTEVISSIGFHDAQGKPVASVQEKLVGMSHGGTDLIDNEFARNPITPKEMRFFRISVPVENVPPTWNHEVPELTIIAAKAR